MNLLAYAVYLVLTYAITVHVGHSFYTNGRVYILGMLHNDHALTDQVNKVLLTGYYLMNIGYATLMLAGWDRIENIVQLMEIEYQHWTDRTVHCLHALSQHDSHSVMEENKQIIHC